MNYRSQIDLVGMNCMVHILTCKVDGRHILEVSKNAETCQHKWIESRTIYSH